MPKKYDITVNCKDRNYGPGYKGDILYQKDESCDKLERLHLPRENFETNPGEVLTVLDKEGNIGWERLGTKKCYNFTENNTTFKLPAGDNYSKKQSLIVDCPEKVNLLSFLDEGEIPTAVDLKNEDLGVVISTFNNYCYVKKLGSIKSSEDQEGDLALSFGLTEREFAAVPSPTLPNEEVLKDNQFATLVINFTKKVDLSIKVRSSTEEFLDSITIYKVESNNSINFYNTLSGNKIFSFDAYLTTEYNLLMNSGERIFLSYSKNSKLYSGWDNCYFILESKYIIEPEEEINVFDKFQLGVLQNNHRYNCDGIDIYIPYINDPTYSYVWNVAETDNNSYPKDPLNTKVIQCGYREIFNPNSLDDKQPLKDSETSFFYIYCSGEKEQVRLKLRYSTEFNFDFLTVKKNGESIAKLSGFSSSERYLASELIVFLDKSDELYIEYSKDSNRYRGYDHVYLIVEKLTYPSINFSNQDGILYSKNLRDVSCGKIYELNDFIQFKDNSNLFINSLKVNKDVKVKYCIEYDEGNFPEQLTVVNDLKGEFNLEGELKVDGNATITNDFEVEGRVNNLIVDNKNRSCFIGSTANIDTNTFNNLGNTTSLFLVGNNNGKNSSLKFGLDGNITMGETGGIFYINSTNGIELLGQKKLMYLDSRGLTTDKINCELLKSTVVDSGNIEPSGGKNLQLKTKNSKLTLKPSSKSATLEYKIRPTYDNNKNSSYVRYVIESGYKHSLNIIIGDFIYINGILSVYNDNNLSLFEAGPYANFFPKIENKKPKNKGLFSNRSFNFKNKKIPVKNFDIHKLLESEPITGTEIKLIKKYKNKFFGEFNVYRQFYDNIPIFGTTINVIVKDDKVVKVLGKVVDSRNLPGLDNKEKQKLATNEKLIKSFSKKFNITDEVKGIKEFIEEWRPEKGEYIKCKTVEIEHKFKETVMFNSETGDVIRKLNGHNFLPTPTNYKLADPNNYRNYNDANVLSSGLAATNDFVGNESVRRLISTHNVNHQSNNIVHESKGQIDVNGYKYKFNFYKNDASDLQSIFTTGNVLISDDPDNTAELSYWDNEDDRLFYSSMYIIPRVYEGLMKEYDLGDALNGGELTVVFIPNYPFGNGLATQIFGRNYHNYYSKSRVINSMSVAAHEMIHTFQYDLFSDIMYVAVDLTDISDERGIFTEGYADLLATWAIQYVNNSSVIDENDKEKSFFNKTDPTRELYMSDVVSGFGSYTTRKENQTSDIRGSFFIPPYVYKGVDWDNLITSYHASMPFQRLSYILQNGTNGEEVNEFLFKYSIEPPTSVNPDPNAKVAPGFYWTFYLFIYTWIMYVGPSTEKNTYTIFKNGFYDLAVETFGPNGVHPKPQYINAVKEGLKSVNLEPDNGPGENTESDIHVNKLDVKVNFIANELVYVEYNDVETGQTPRITTLAGSTYEIAAADPITGCGAITNDLTGKIALIQRGGTCFFYNMIQNAQNKGAVGVMFYNNEEGLINIVGTTVGIPAIFIKKADGDIIKQFLDFNSTVTVSFTNNVTDPKELIFNHSKSWFESIGLDVEDVSDANSKLKISKFQFMYINDKCGGSSYFNGVSTEVINEEEVEKATFNIDNLPTSATGLEKGDLYQESGYIRIVE